MSTQLLAWPKLLAELNAIHSFVFVRDTKGLFIPLQRQWCPFYWYILNHVAGMSRTEAVVWTRGCKIPSQTHPGPSLKSMRGILAAVLAYEDVATNTQADGSLFSPLSNSYSSSEEDFCYGLLRVCYGCCYG